MLFELLRVGLGAIRAHKFRAGLTVLSITIGAFSIVLMSSLAQSGIATLTRGVEEVGGARMVVFFPRSPEKAEKKRSSYTRGLTLSDAAELAARIPHLQHVTMHTSLGARELRVAAETAQTAQTPEVAETAKTPASARTATAPRTDVRSRGDLVAGGPEFLASFSMKLAAGRNLDSGDLAGRTRVAVIGHGVAEALFPSPEAALGRVLRLENESYRVVGVAAKIKRFGPRFGFDWNEFVLAPLTAVLGVQGGVIMLMTEDVRYNDLVHRLGTAILTSRHRGVDDFEAFDFGAMIEKFKEVFRIMQIIVAFISGLALVVGGIGVMNILLVSVSERVREIGLRKAVGAADSAIAAQFLFESTLLSALGGLVGVLAGIGGAIAAGAFIVRKEEAWVPLVATEAVVAALFVSMLVGVVFGFVPARRAGRLSVVDCLRAAG